ncbi:MAG: MFS transporter [Acidobacteriota bacterium]
MHGLYLLWWVQERGMPAATVAAILAAGDLAIVAVEVPTGWFADRLGHRLSLIVGSACQVAGMLLCWLGQGIPGLVAASVLVGLGDGFRSGADQALLYRSCVALGREADFQRIEARTRAVQISALVGLVMAGGFIVQRWGFATGWLLETLLCTTGLVLAWAMAEPPAAAEPPEDGIAENGRTIAVNGLAALSLLILPLSVLGGLTSAAAFLAQTSGRTDPQALTLLVAAISLAEAAGAIVAARMPSSGILTQAVLASLGLGAAITGAIRPSVFPAAVIGLSFLDGLAHPLRAAAMQRLAADAMRARAASFASACDKACDTVLLLAAGVWRR